ncbi:MAG: hypothetical protein ACR2HN_02930 [Tepidiformaceae bacterium]
MRIVAGLLALFGALAAVAPAAADDRDRVIIGSDITRLGEPVVLIIEVGAPAGTTVEIDPGAPTWSGVEVVALEDVQSRPDGDSLIHTLRLTVAPFVIGGVEFAPAVNVVAEAEATPRTLPSLRLTVVSSLAPDAPLELSLLAPPEEIGGAQSPWLVPAIIAGVAAVSMVMAMLLFVAGRQLVRILRPPRPEIPAPLRLPPDLDGAAALLNSDPVRAYRALAALVRRILSSRYGFPAMALTTTELRGRMEAEGVDRWQARLVGGLLEECDAVVYAGYRPAEERRVADLNMAREIVEATG